MGYFNPKANFLFHYLFHRATRTLYIAYESVHLFKKLELFLMSGYLTVSVKLISKCYFLSTRVLTQTR